jgi:hypothetical protein
MIESGEDMQPTKQTGRGKVGMNSSGHIDGGKIFKEEVATNSDPTGNACMKKVLPEAGENAGCLTAKRGRCCVRGTRLGRCGSGCIDPYDE